jgi:hypothetical protein
MTARLIHFPSGRPENKGLRSPRLATFEWCRARQSELIVGRGRQYPAPPPWAHQSGLRAEREASAAVWESTHCLRVSLMGAKQDRRPPG